MAETAQAATPEEVAAAYFKAWKAGDIDRVRPLLHPDVDFLGRWARPAASRRRSAGWAACSP